jgi:glycosyltransferase involved in cell wall biosynthesis
MSWYKKYLSIYEQPLDSIPLNRILEISGKLKAKQSSHPLVSVVLIAHNEESHILSCLWSLAENDCKYLMEILVVNNTSTDRTVEVLEKIGVPWFDEKKKGPGFARQCGLDNARGDYYVCIDADTIYPRYYVQTMIDNLSKKNIMAVYGLWSFLPDKEISKIQIFFFELLRDCYLVFQNIKRPELNVRGMVMAFRIEEGRKYGFRTDLIRGEDGSLALDLKNEGKIKLILSRGARPITSNAVLKVRGSLGKAFLFRLSKVFRGFLGLFVSKKHYEDDDSNIIGRK